MLEQDTQKQNNYDGMHAANQNENREPEAATAPDNMQIDDKAVKKIVGQSISKVDGVLGLEGGMTDLLKSSDDVTKGISVSISDDQKAEIGVKIVTEFGKSIPEIVQNVTSEITENLQSMAGLRADKVEVEVTDTMSREEYDEKNKNKRSS